MLLLIGKKPPPIGGVTVHFNRLTSALESTQIDFEVVFLNNLKLNDFRKLMRASTIHLHLSNVFVQLAIVAFYYIIRKKIIITYHNNIGHYNKLKKFVVSCSIRLSHIPIVLNESSFQFVQKYNKEVRLISSFITPPEPKELLDSVLIDSILELRKNHESVFCTYAFNYAFDKQEREIYQITEVVKIFNDQPDLGLIVSDPSGAYYRHFKNNKVHIGKNVFIINKEHDFSRILQYVDCFIRYTTTDGDSLSLKEALYWGVDVIATNVVSRPNNVTLINLNIDELKNTLLQYKKEKRSEITKVKDAFPDLFQIYNQMLAQK